MDIETCRSIAFDTLMRLYTHMSLWQTEPYSSLDSRDQQDFREMVKNDTLVQTVENWKKECLRLGVPMKDRWLWPLCAMDITPDEPLPDFRRDELRRIIDDMYPMTVRLDSAADEVKYASNETTPVPDNGKRPAYYRDHLFLTWYETEGAETYHSPAKISDKWEAIPIETRKRDYPTAPGNVNREIVRKGIAAAKKDIGK